jgi:hypothetical protein
VCVCGGAGSVVDVDMFAYNMSSMPYQGQSLLPGLLTGCSVMKMDLHRQLRL